MAVLSLSPLYLTFIDSAVVLFYCSSSLHGLDTLAGLLDLSLLYHLWISGTFLLFTWFITVLLFRVYVSEVLVVLMLFKAKTYSEVYDF